MAIGRWMKNGGALKSTGWAALAAGLALAALPASAQERQGRGGWRGGDNAAAQSSDSGRSRGGWNGGGGEGRRGSADGGAPAWRGRQQSTVQTAPSAPQAAPEARQSWQGRGGEGQRGNWQRGDGQRWRGGNAGQVGTPQNGVEQRQAQARDAARQNGWNGRNRTYVDPGRNRSYVDRNFDRGNWRSDTNERRWDRNNNDRPAWRGNGRNDDRWDNDRRGSQRWNNAWRNDRRYDWRGYRDSNRNIYRIGRYYAPYRNYYYRPLGIGFYLDSMFYGSNYWINDPWQYRLPPAEYGYRWVRYYDDVLLVDTYTGEVVDVIRDFFW